ncbi:MAG TPA: NAD(P)H-hydrate dehydratase [Syntrophorhabdales bacterium]|nr:NAD(P)H-hydrate dehydratase [Syntrophorhabdales bacterium]
MKVLSPERMKRYDDYAINTWGIPSAVLMENAGRTTYRLLRKKYLTEKKKLTICCGRGNNGGDGFVIARYALRDGFETSVVLTCEPEDLKGDAALNMELYRKLNGAMTVIRKLADIRQKLKEAELLIDAIFGTGLSKEVQGIEKALIEQMNASKRPIVAVDIPSGLDAMSGVPLGVAVTADSTYTYGYAKIGQLLYPGAAHVGELTVVDIALPPAAEKDIGVDAEVVDGDMLRSFLKSRRPFSHKGSFGHALIISGSTGKTGAAAMASDAALKIGAGLVTLVIPRSLNAIMETKLTEVMTFPVEDNGKGHLAEDAFDQIESFARDKDVIVIGPGLSTTEETMTLVRKLYVELDKPFVVDADGITSFQGHERLIRKKEKRAVFTPHPGEIGRLVGLSPAEVNADRLNIGRRFVATHGIDLVLKGARTTIFGADGSLFINPTGNAALAKGGSGDILTGFIGGLLSQGYTSLEASLLGVYLHGYIADTWVATRSDMDLVAVDLLKGVGEALRELRRGTDRTYIKRAL